MTLDLEGVAAVDVSSRRRGIVARAVAGEVGALAGGGLDALQVVRDGDRLRITEPRREDGDGGETTALELSLPAERSWDLAADTASGRVLVAGVDGTVRVRTANGAVTVQDLTGSAEVRCANGSITAERISGQLAVSAANGKVTVRDAELTGGKFHNASGRMALQVRPTGDGKLSIMSGSGRVLLALPVDADATIEARGRLVSRLGSSIVASGAGCARVTLGSGAFSIFVHTPGRCELVGFDEFEDRQRRAAERADDDHAWEDRDFTFESFELPEEMRDFVREMRGYGLKFGKLGEEISRQVAEAFAPGRGGPRGRGQGRPGQGRPHGRRRGGPRPAPGCAPGQTGTEAEQAGTEQEVKLVLEMLKDGKLSAEEATRLIGALRS